jgi:hypothetical protein
MRFAGRQQRVDRAVRTHRLWHRARAPR